MGTGAIGYSGQPIKTTPVIVNPDVRVIPQSGQPKMILAQNTSHQTTPINPFNTCLPKEEPTTDPYTIYLTKYAVTEQDFIDYAERFANERDILVHGPDDYFYLDVVPSVLECVGKHTTGYQYGRVRADLKRPELKLPFYDQAKAWYKEHGPQLEAGIFVVISPTQELLQENGGFERDYDFEPDTHRLYAVRMSKENYDYLKSKVKPEDLPKIDELYHRSNWPPYFQEKVRSWLADYYLYLFLNEQIVKDPEIPEEKKPQNIDQMRKNYEGTRNGLLDVFPKQYRNQIIFDIENRFGTTFRKNISRFGHLMKREQSKSFPYICERLDKMNNNAEALEVVKEAHEIFQRIGSENVMGLINMPRYYIEVIQDHFRRYIGNKSSIKVK